MLKAISIPKNILGHIAKHNEDSEDGVKFFIAFIGLTAQKQNESIRSPKQATKNPQSEQKYWINTQSDAFSRSAFFFSRKSDDLKFYSFPPPL